MTGQGTDDAQDSPTWRAPVELLVVLGPGSPPASGPGSPLPPANPPPRCPPPPGLSTQAAAPPPPPRPLTALEALRQHVRVSQECQPRLALVTVPTSAVPLLEALPFVAGVYDTPPPAEVLATLGEGELLFVRAWLTRRADPDHHGDDDRPGQGLPWDAPGYQPPDAATG